MDDLEKLREEKAKEIEQEIGRGLKHHEREALMTKVVKSKSKSPVRNVDRDVGVLKPGDASIMAEHMINFLTWDEYDRSDPEELIQRFKDYVTYCQYHDIKITNEACYMAMGLQRGTMTAWFNGVWGSPAHQKLARKILQFLTANREIQMVEGKLNPIVGIWWQKNYDGLKDTQEIVFTSRDPLEGFKTVDELEEKYAESVGKVDIPALPPERKEENET